MSRPVRMLVTRIRGPAALTSRCTAFITVEEARHVLVVLAQRVSARPVIVCQFLVNDRHGSRLLLVDVGELAPAIDPHARCFEVIEVYRVHYGGDLVGLRSCLAPFHHQSIHGSTPERLVRGPGYRLDAGYLRHAFADLFVERFGLRLVVAGRSGVRHEQRQVFGLEARIDIVRPPYASQEQACGHQ